MDQSNAYMSAEQKIRVDNLFIRIVVFEKMTVTDIPSFILPHNHNSFELRVILGGNALIHAGDKNYQVQESDLFITPPLMYHSFEPIEKKSYYRSVRFNFEHSDDPESIERCHRILQQLREPIQIRPKDHWIEELIARMNCEFEEALLGYKSRIAALSTSLIMSLMQILFPESNLHWDDKCTTHDSQQEVSIEQFFAFHYSENISINMLAKELNLSIRQTNRILEKFYNCSFSDKLMQVRLENIKLEIKRSKRSIADIASSNGFRSLPYFYTAFKKYYGHSPGLVRKSYSENITNIQEATPKTAE